jgi:hypothetical protein
VCHSPLEDARIWTVLLGMDQDAAEQVRHAGCAHCGGALHVANYPRKPRGVCRVLLGVAYEQRLSFCCTLCRRRATPPSVRFLGRKAYLGIIITLVSALENGLSPQRRRRLINELDLSAQTLHRWRIWWLHQVPPSRCWRKLAGLFSPAINTPELPGALLGRLLGEDLLARLVQLLNLISPLTTRSSGSAVIGGRYRSADVVMANP